MIDALEDNIWQAFIGALYGLSLFINELGFTSVKWYIMGTNVA